MTETRVYFIRAIGTDLIKIGVADDPRQRLRDLQVGSAHQLEIVTEIPGDERYESVLHRRFDNLRAHGEWFKCEGDLAVLIRVLPTLPSETRPRSKARERKPVERPAQPLIHHPAMKRHWADHLAMLGEVIARYGVAKFAAEIKKPRWLLIAWLQERGHHKMPLFVETALLAKIPKPEAARLLRHALLDLPSKSDLGLPHDPAAEAKLRASIEEMIANAEQAGVELLEEMRR